MLPGEASCSPSRPPRRTCRMATSPRDSTAFRERGKVVSLSPDSPRLITQEASGQDDFFPPAPQYPLFLYHPPPPMPRWKSNDSKALICLSFSLFLFFLFPLSLFFSSSLLSFSRQFVLLWNYGFTNRNSNESLTSTILPVGMHYQKWA